MIAMGIKGRKHENLIGWLFVLPLALYFLVFQLAPMLMSLGISFTDWDWRTSLNWVGLRNYIELFTDRILYPDFWKSLGVSVLYMLLTVPASVFCTLIVSAMLNSKVKGERFFKSAFFIPSVTAGVAISAIWMFLIDPTYGIVGFINQHFGTSINLLGRTATALPTLAFISVWSGLGYNTLIMLSAMKGINPALYEACELDGGTAWHKFWHVTLPGIRSTTYFIIVTSIIGALQAFDQMYLMTGGGPDGSTKTFMLEIYQLIFNYQEVGTASAMSYVLFTLILLVTIVSQRFLPGHEARAERKAVTHHGLSGRTENR